MPSIKKQKNNKQKTQILAPCLKMGMATNLKIIHNYSVLKVIVLRFQKNRSTRTKFIAQKSLCLQTKFVVSSAH
jgi:hypothetical protein